MRPFSTETIDKYNNCRDEERTDNQYMPATELERHCFISSLWSLIGNVLNPRFHDQLYIVLFVGLWQVGPYNSAKNSSSSWAVSNGPSVIKPIECWMYTANESPNIEKSKYLKFNKDLKARNVDFFLFQ